MMLNTRKPKRTLVALHSEPFRNRQLDLGILEKEAQLTILFFFQEAFQCHLNLRNDFRASGFPIPTTVERPQEFITQTVLYELTVQSIYDKIVFLDSETDLYQATLAFLKTKDINSEAFNPTTPVIMRLDPTKGGKEELQKTIHFEDHAGGEPEKILSFSNATTVKKRRKRKVKLPTTPENMTLVMGALLKHFTPGAVYSKTQISPIIHKETELNVKELFAYKNLTGLYRYLISIEMIEPVDAKNFRVRTTQWQLADR